MCYPIKSDEEIIQGGGAEIPIKLWINQQNHEHNEYICSFLPTIMQYIVVILYIIFG